MAFPVKPVSKIDMPAVVCIFFMSAFSIQDYNQGKVDKKLLFQQNLPVKPVGNFVVFAVVATPLIVEIPGNILH
jgi:hypothetical protein